MKNPCEYYLQGFRKLICDSGGTRTHNQQNRNLPFYPLNYGARSCKDKKSAGIFQKPVHEVVLITLNSQPVTYIMDVLDPDRGVRMQELAQP